MRDRARGALLGLAVGDALGTTLEFTRRDAQPHHTEMTGGGPFGLAPGQWSDHTAMALALADSLLARRSFDARHAMDRFVRWWTSGEYSCTGACFDIGATTSEALQRYLDTGEPFAGSTREDTAGNGSLMRLAPVVLFGWRDARATTWIAAEQSRTTHAAPQAVQACELFADLLCTAVLSGKRDEVFRPRNWRGHESLSEVAGCGYLAKRREAVSSSGYVVATLEAALWAAASSSSFEDALILAVNLAYDADTVGAVTGQIAGALYGASAIPVRWLEPLAWRERIEAAADALLDAGGELT
jgi:ADP-ribosyl-[dinitrogen reductase] hydrolase